MLKKKIEKHKVLIKNFSYLSALQVFNTLLPLITYPYLIRVLGSETYGMIVYAQAIIGYLVVLVGFGFNISATKEVSINRNDKLKLGEIISSVYIIKGSLFILSLILLTIILKLLPQNNEQSLLIYLTMWMCLYEFIFPIFYFQGIEKMKYITFLTLISRVIFLVLIFVLVRAKDDYLKVPLINGIGALITGVISIYLIRKDKIKIKRQPFNIILIYIKKSYVMALAYASNTFKSSFNIIAVKILFSFREVAYFDLALKILSIGTTFMDLISQTVFPKMSREKDSIFLRKLIKLTLVLSSVFIIFIYLFSNNLIIVIGGGNMQESSYILKILVFFIPIYSVGALLGRNCLIINGFDKEVLLSMLYSSMFYISLLGLTYLMGIKISLTLLCVIYLASYLLETIYRYKICKIKNIY